MKTQVLFLNGPPSSGKDFVGNLIAKRYTGHNHVDKFARVLKESTHALYGIFVKGKPAPWYWFEDRKDEPCGELFGLTPRQAYIGVSEDYMKKHHGSRIFGELLLRDLRIHAVAAQRIIITDSGFRGEAEVMVEHYGPQNCKMIHIRRSECSFDGDSRDWVDLRDLGVSTLVLHNPGDATVRDHLDQLLPRC